MSISPRPPVRAPSTERSATTGWARAARQVIAASTRGRTRRVGWLAGVATATSLVAACGSVSPGQPAAAPTVTVTVASPADSVSPPPSIPATAPSGIAATAPSTVPVPVPSKPVPSGGAGAPGSLAGCRTATLHLAVDASQAQGAAGSAYYPLNFTNTSGTSCEMYGYPGVSFTATPVGAGRQVGAAAQRSSGFTKVAVRLAPGQTAHAWLKVTVAGNFPAAVCQPVTAHWLRVYPPGETVAGYVGHTFDACASASAAVLSVLPVRAGQGTAGVTP
jgi:hypothetical protein